MRKLDRSQTKSPECLANFNYSTHTWSSMNCNDNKKRKKRKKQVWDEIDKMQGRLCAYCESFAYKGKDTGHIEHFFDKGNPLYKPLTFDWNNLFGCCQSISHCGHFKDAELPGGKKREYNSELLIKPDIDDPDEYLQFLPSGVIQEKRNLDTDKAKRATETIKAFNLTSTALKNTRNGQINLYKKRLLLFVELGENMTKENINDYFAMKSEAMEAPHRTAIKQALSWL